MRWEETSEPVPVSPLAALGEAVGLAGTLEAVACSSGAALTVVMPDGLRAEVDRFLRGHAVEAGGLLLGRRFELGERAGSPLVLVERFVPGRVFEGTGVSLALGTELWDDARPWIDGGLAVVGWVHSHPDLGAFFSGTDRRTQRAFFGQPWQFGLCVDPVRGEQAWFRGADSLPDGLQVVRV